MIFEKNEQVLINGKILAKILDIPSNKKGMYRLEQIGQRIIKFAYSEDLMKYGSLKIIYPLDKNN